MYDLYYSNGGGEVLQEKAGLSMDEVKAYVAQNLHRVDDTVGFVIAHEGMAVIQTSEEGDLFEIPNIPIEEF